MENTSYIIDLPLPPAQDFKFLKEKGLDFVRENGGPEWSNLNSSDPGITILEQVCFALSELGYCTDFSVPDLLTGVNEKLKLKNQFFQPEQILTTSPITEQDYINYLVDEVEELSNAIVISTTQNGLQAYQVYLQLNNWKINNSRSDEICNKTYYALNKVRNIGEFFLLPIALERISVFISGTLTIENNRNVSALLERLQVLCDNYIFPSLKQKGFDELYANYPQTDNILNGPLLQNGWIDKSESTKKKDSIGLMDMLHILKDLGAIPTVEITHLSKSTDDIPSEEIQVAPNQLLNVDIIGSIQKGLLSIENKNVPLAPAEIISRSHAELPEPGIHPEVLNKSLYELPTSSFRNVSGYYSIQNTFPEIFAAGADAITSYAAEYQVAQSRQLKGYLTLFDQVLANQFSQLANIDKLFSFTNSTTASPAETSNFYSKQNKVEEYHGIYPVPYKTFSPTYFYQSLYDVPHIKPLLKNNDVFEFKSTQTTIEEEDHKSWEAYKLDPYNSYIHGLMECIDDEATNLDRRNKLLNHLLARHGESPSFIDEVTDGADYTGDSLKDKVILKSLLLQNLALISYHRVKGINYITQDPIKRKLPKLHSIDASMSKDDDTRDFIEGKASEGSVSHLRNYCSIEIKLHILFSISLQYKHFLAENLLRAVNKQEIQIAGWLIQERLGFIMIETRLLQYFLKKGTNTTEINKEITNEPFTDDVIFLFPSFIPHFTTPGFKKRLDYFLKNTLPVTVSYKSYFIDKDSFLALIPAYANWINRIRISNKNKTDRSFEASVKLSNTLNNITRLHV